MDLPALVACERRNMRLTESSCAKSWRSANPDAPPVWEGRHACHQCLTGASRAGETIDPFKVARERLAPICTRCLNLSDRIINGKFCASCYNRDLEAAKGRNAKGGMPRLAAIIGPLSRTVMVGGRPQLVTWPRVSCLAEAAMQAAKGASAPVSIGLRPPIPPAWMRAPRAPLPHQMAFAF